MTRKILMAALLLSVAAPRAWAQGAPTSGTMTGMAMPKAAPAAPQAAKPQAAGVSVTRVWARATSASQKNGAAYFTIANPGADDTLTGAATPVADMAELHRTSAVNGVMQMRPVASVKVPHGQLVTFGPGGLHVMLMGLKQPLKQGDSFPLTLTFAKAGDVTVNAVVQSAGAMSPTR